MIVHGSPRALPGPWLWPVAILVAVAALSFTEWRLWQGMDLADESFYVAVPYRFSVGTRPFVDELSFLQVPAFLTYPLVKPFVALQGGHADGIMMYMRHLYLAFAMGVAAAVFLAARRLLAWQFEPPRVQWRLSCLSPSSASKEAASA
jgi:hypothetical protein